MAISSERCAERLNLRAEKSTGTKPFLQPLCSHFSSHVVRCDGLQWEAEHPLANSKNLQFPA